MMYKCTDGTMSTSDFSGAKCLDFGLQAKSNVISNVTTSTVTSSPLLSGDGGSMGNLFGSGGSGDDDDDVDYSSYVDYYKISNDGVKVNQYPDRNQDGEPDFVDSVDVEVYGPGECAKICYENEKLIDDRSCNAFKMTSDGKKCTLYWSQSDSGRRETESVYRLKQPRDSYSHEIEKENDLMESSSNVHVFSSINYDGSHKQYDLDGDYNLNQQFYSIVVPSDRCVRAYTGRDLGGASSDIDMSQRSVSGGIRSFTLGSINEAGNCVYRSRDDGDEEEFAELDGSNYGTSGACEYIAGAYLSVIRDEQCRKMGSTEEECTRNTDEIEPGVKRCVWRSPATTPP